MAKGVIFSEGDFKRASDAIRRVEQDPRYGRRPIPTRQRNPPATTQTKVGILDGALSAASNALDTPATATLSIYTYDSSGDLEDSGNNITVTNRYTEISTIASGSLLMVIRHGSEWWPITADCGATTIS